MKQFRLSFLFTMLMSMMSSNAFAYDVIGVENKDGVKIYYALVYDDKDDLVLEVTRPGFGYEGELLELFIPEEVTYKGQTLKVTSIGSLAFHACNRLTSVTIPNSIITIGDYAFAYCTNLTSMTIPNSVRSIGYFAFAGCTGLTSITIPKSVLSIDHSFNECSGITSISVEDGNMKYDSRGNCNALIETASNTLLFGCVNTIIPNSVTSIGDHAFAYCTSLTSMTIPNSIITIGDYAFFSCDNLTSVTIPNSVTDLGIRAFRNCYSLTSVTIGNSVTSIGESAFSECSSLTSVTIGNSVTSIGDDAFYRCSSLTSVTIPNSVTSIGDDAFNNCSGLTSVTIGNSVTSIGQGAFCVCSSLSFVTIPNSVTSIDIAAFGFCTNLVDVYCYSEKVSNEWDGQGLYTSPFAFSNSNPEFMNLHVPEGCIDAYKAIEPWNQFKVIVLIDNTGINPVSSYNTVKEVYSIGGERRLSPQKGVNIIKMNDGTTKKVLVK